MCTVCPFIMGKGESSPACYQNAAALHIVIKVEPPPRLSPSLLLSFMLYLSSRLFFCIMLPLLDPISIIEILSSLLNLSAEASLCSDCFYVLSSFFSIPCWLHHYNLVSWPICCFGCCFHCSAGVFVTSPLNL